MAYMKTNCDAMQSKNKTASKRLKIDEKTCQNHEEKRKQSTSTKSKFQQKKNLLVYFFLCALPFPLVASTGGECGRDWVRCLFNLPPKSKYSFKSSKVYLSQ